MSQTLIDALDALENQVAVLSAETAALSSVVNAADPAEVGRKAQEGARRGAATAVSGLSEITYSLKEAVQILRQRAVPAVQEAQQSEGRRRWWKTLVLVLSLILGLLAAFSGGSLVGVRVLPSEIFVSRPGCSLIGGVYYPPQLTSTKRTLPACVVYGSLEDNP